jgi:hypothetical protein
LLVPAELPQENCDAIVQAVPSSSEQRLQEFRTNMHWDEEDLNRQRMDKMIAKVSHHVVSHHVLVSGSDSSRGSCRYLRVQATAVMRPCHYGRHPELIGPVLAHLHPEPAVEARRFNAGPHDGMISRIKANVC